LVQKVFYPVGKEEVFKILLAPILYIQTMPGSNFNSFISNYRSSIVCKKVRFCIPKTVLNFFILKKLLEDCYIRSFKSRKFNYDVISIDLSTTLTFNRVVKYSTPRRPVFVSFKKLLELSKTGGYYLISTKMGIVNDSLARKN
jgi:ribosomal protein S8